MSRKLIVLGSGFARQIAEVEAQGDSMDLSSWGGGLQRLYTSKANCMYAFGGGIVRRSQSARNSIGMTWSTKSLGLIRSALLMPDAYIENNRRNAEHRCGSIASSLNGLIMYIT